jgi:K+-sensing histidine kinase KdpD
VTEHSSIYTAAHRDARRGELHRSTAKPPRPKGQPPNLADEVLATLLHELRTPLAIMTGWSRMLQQQYSDQQDEFLQRGLGQLTKHTAAQAALLARAGDFCDLWTGRAGLARERVDLFDLARIALRGQLATAAQRGVQQAATFEVPEGLVMGDYARLRQMVVELCGSALETTPVGHRLQVHGAVGEQFVVLSLHAMVDDAALYGDAASHEDGHAPSDEQGDRRRLTGALARGLVALHGGVLTVTPRQNEIGELTTIRLPRGGAGVVRDDADEIFTGVDAEHEEH